MESKQRPGVVMGLVLSPVQSLTYSLVQIPYSAVFALPKVSMQLHVVMNSAGYFVSTIYMLEFYD